MSLTEQQIAQVRESLLVGLFEARHALSAVGRRLVISEFFHVLNRRKAITNEQTEREVSQVVEFSRQDLLQSVWGLTPR
nr:hypothetical protein [Candidatus Njordarchaeota archaeon]